MSDITAIERHYKYWNDFIKHWFECGRSCCLFLPEPWWGWTPYSGRPLYSVVLNLNPGKGGADQTRSSLNDIFGSMTYSEAMKEKLPKHLTETNAWHNGHRAKPIISKLKGISIPDDEYIAHHLSVELSPLHEVNSASVDSYVVANLEEVVDHSLLFAADASRMIAGPLRGVVIVRCEAKRFMNMFNARGVEMLDAASGESKQMRLLRFERPEFKDVKFVCVWGARNNLPTEAIREIINNIIN